MFSVIGADLLDHATLSMPPVFWSRSPAPADGERRGDGQQATAINDDTVGRMVAHRDRAGAVECYAAVDREVASSLVALIS